MIANLSSGREPATGVFIIAFVTLAPLAFLQCAFDGSGRGTCEERAEAARRQVESVRLQNLSCAQKSDCVLFDLSTECGGDCPTPIASAGIASLERAIDEVNDTICRNYAADGCAVSTPSCAQLEPRCVEQKCVGVNPSR